MRLTPRRWGGAMYPFNHIIAEFRAMHAQRVPWYEYPRTAWEMTTCWYDGSAEWFGANRGMEYDHERNRWD